ncbi:unnamed protein product, partial [Gulo gulo]
RQSPRHSARSWPGPGAHTLRPEGAASLFQNGDASSLRSATVTGPATWTDELGAGRPGAVRGKASSFPGGEGRRARPAEPGSDSLGCGEAPLQSAQKDEIDTLHLPKGTGTHVSSSFSPCCLLCEVGLLGS